MADESFHLTYQAIGRVVSTWARLEKSLFAFFGTIHGPSILESAAIFFAWRGFEQKLNLVNEIMQLKFAGKDELKFWNPLKSYIFALAKERNFIVHNEVIPMTRFEKIESGSAEKISLTIAQESSPFEVHLLKKTLRRLETEEIQTAEHAICILFMYLDGFRAYLNDDPLTSREKFRRPLFSPFLENYLLPPERRTKQTPPRRPFAR